MSQSRFQVDVSVRMAVVVGVLLAVVVGSALAISFGTIVEAAGDDTHVAIILVEQAPAATCEPPALEVKEEPLAEEKVDPRNLPAGGGGPKPPKKSPSPSKSQKLYTSDCPHDGPPSFIDGVTQCELAERLVRNDEWVLNILRAQFDTYDKGPDPRAFKCTLLEDLLPDMLMLSRINDDARAFSILALISYVCGPDSIQEGGLKGRMQYLNEGSQPSPTKANDWM